jgi:structure-specific recognition protein 1
MRVVSKLDSTDHVFSAISKEEVQPISAFLQSKNVRLQNEMDEIMELDPISDDDDDEDDDVSIPSEDEKPKKGKDKAIKKPSRADDEEDESGKLPSWRSWFMLQY